MRLKPLFIVAIAFVVALLLSVVVGAHYAGVPLSGIAKAPRIGAALAAKIACSGHFVSGFPVEKVAQDIRVFSPALAWAELNFSEPERVEAQLLGATAVARFYPGLGCTLQYPAMHALEAIAFPQVARAPDQLVTAASVRNAKLQSAVAELMASDQASGLDTRAILVIQGRRLRAEVYADGVNEETPLLGWSMAKSLTALIAGRMEAMGLLSVHDSQLFPQWMEDARSEITVEQLLQMVSGLAFSEPYVPGNDSTRMLFNAESASTVPLEKALAFPPGTHFAYSSGTTNLICRLFVERLGDPQAFINFFTREVATPLGLRNTVVELDPMGRCVGSSFVYAPARDWARMVLPLLNAGWAGQQQWLSKGWVSRALTPNPSRNNPRYGYQFWLNRGGETQYWPDLPEDTFSMSGHNGQVVIVIPSRDIVIVRLGWSQGEYPANDRFNALLAYLQ